MPIPRAEFFRTLTVHHSPASPAFNPAEREAARLTLEILRRAPGDFHSFADIHNGIASMPDSGAGMNARPTPHHRLELALVELVADGKVEAYPHGGAMYFAARP